MCKSILNYIDWNTTGTEGSKVLEVVSKRRKHIGGNIEIILEIYCAGTELRKYIGGYSAG